jgi:uncharacterized protein (TIGR02001 family)
VHIRLPFFFVVATVFGVLPALPCRASAAAAQADRIEAEVAVVSDYRFRGVSLTRGKPALQGSIDIALADQWAVGAWASLTADQHQDADELDLYAGRSGMLGNLEYGVIAYAYIVPGTDGGSYVELQGTLRRQTEVAVFELELSMVPHQSRAVPTNVYAAMRSTVPLIHGGPALLIEGGFEQGMAKAKLSWEAGLLGERGRFQYKLSATGSTARYGPGGSTATIVLALSHSL